MAASPPKGKTGPVGTLELALFVEALLDLEADRRKLDAAKEPASPEVKKAV